MLDLSGVRGERICPLFLDRGLTSAPREPPVRAKLTSSSTLHLHTGIQVEWKLEAQQEQTGGNFAGCLRSP